MWLRMILLIHCSTLSEEVKPASISLDWQVNIVALLGKDGKGAEETGKSSKGKEPGKDAW